ncbi:alpha/beta hydrolase [Corynebacterium halotolerans]|uniref:alpha/beta hydrolase n=1 Tax=Corynebacterium halotolerans TaxID=225326 RepID=UPI003CEC9C53
MSRTPWRIALSGVVVSSLFLASPAAAAAPADAEEDSSLLGSSNSVLQDLVTGSSQFQGSTGSSIDAALSSMSLLGSSEMSFEGPLLSSEDGYPLETDPTITEPEVIKIVEDTRADRLERWYVASPSMKRVVEVQVMRPADPTAAAPMLYLLDGIGGNKNSSGWINDKEAPRVFEDEDVTVVMPLGAAASMYSDWQEEDPALGTIKWETFITEELAPLLEQEESLNFNGKRAIGGLSMGAAGAVHLANSNPDFFDGVIGISGCYSTLDQLGRTTVQLIVGSRGGDVTNMWGDFGSGTWQEHDVTRDPSGLLNMPVYLSAATGAIGEADEGIYADEPFYNMVAGVVLERGSMECTQNLENSLETAGAEDLTVNYADTGGHNWSNYNAQLQPGWNAIRDALY